MVDRLNLHREEVTRAIERAFSRKDTPFHDIAFWSADVSRRLKEYVLRGKLIRGTLVPFSYSLFSPKGTIPRSCFDTAAVMELLQSFLLIHDDIMDQDLVRRGLPSVHAQYMDMTPQPDGISADGSRNLQYGVSMGICAGDVAAFMALHLLSKLPVDGQLRERVMELVTREIMVVGMAQMQDVHNGYVQSIDPDDVLDVYTYKTGRYTFSLPLQLGAIIAGADRERQDLLVKLGERLGRIFQIRDDLLGLMEDTAQTGKPTGSDITENKQTYYRALLFSRLPTDDPMRTLFGNTEISAADVTRIRDALSEYDVLTDIDDKITNEAKRAEEEITALGVTPDDENALRALLEYNLTRRA